MSYQAAIWCKVVSFYFGFVSNATRIFSLASPPLDSAAEVTVAPYARSLQTRFIWFYHVFVIIYLCNNLLQPIKSKANWFYYVILLINFVTLLIAEVYLVLLRNFNNVIV